ncbi:protein kinase domain-containing protein [Lignipirellula cremea]|uniref:Serine/threonine-protein kinase PknB n=1 Tax=Lignipirellula cremea TaxID=2528010 RepID=A0A518DWI1_9BACT|nr:protein kinase [Lignipirellula cremea]QDU96189.1 Serine/threonine-protein kinase PknB [Lignipirellula cremea]
MSIIQLTAEEFQQHLIASGLMAAPAAALRCQQLTGDGVMADGESLAKAMLKRGELTSYQARVLLQIRPQPLVFDDYELRDRLGGGSMGYVCRARHRRNGREAAVKILTASASISPTMLRRFRREAKTAFQMQHPNIVTAFTYGEVNDVHFLAMELVDGPDFHRLVNESGPTSPAVAFDYIRQAALGLQHAHQKGVVHRDVKPANLLVDKQGRVKVVDLGLAAIKEEAIGIAASIGQLTQDGQTLGTADYMAPEQALDTHAADQRADIYALGCVWHYLLLGAPPFRRNSLAETLIAHHEAPIPSLRELGAAVTPEHDAVFQKMLAKNRDDRYADLEQMLAALSLCPALGPPPVQAVDPAQESASSPSGAASAEDLLAARKALPVEPATPSLPLPAPLAPDSLPSLAEVEESRTVHGGSATRDTAWSPPWKKFDPLTAFNGPDRAIAAWVLETGGAIVVRTRKQASSPIRSRIAVATELPDDPLVIEQIDWSENPLLGDSDLPKLGDLQHLSVLNLNGCDITSGALESLAKLPALTELHLQRTYVSDDGLYFVSRIPHLTCLDLRGDNLSDFAVDYLVQMRRLQQLHLPGDCFSQRALVRLQRELPACELKLR